MSTSFDSGPGRLEPLESRGLVAQVTDREAVRALLDRPPTTFYVGFDPTADSLHLGHLLPLVTMRRLRRMGHRPIAVIGGATGLIGDPSGRTLERVLQDAATVRQWSESLRAQIGRLLAEDEAPEAPLLLDNADWIAPLSTVDFLRDVGKHFSVGSMLAKETIRNRLADPDAGLSYTEFSYLLLQAYDFYHLATRHGCRLQIGGSDQWGNMTAGIDFIRRRGGPSCQALTLPLLVDAAGRKFGKSEGGALWLDARRTSPYAFHHYLLNVEDADVGRLLRALTFVPEEEICALETDPRPQARRAQERLASELVAFVHGREALSRVERVRSVLFGDEDPATLDARAWDLLAGAVPTTVLPRSARATPLAALLADTGLVPSRARARESIASGAIRANARLVSDIRTTAAEVPLWADRYLLLQRGRKTHALVVFDDRDGGAKTP
jgi:tyrosyl-tRNA synthetase